MQRLRRKGGWVFTPKGFYTKARGQRSATSGTKRIPAPGLAQSPNSGAVCLTRPEVVVEDSSGLRPGGPAQDGAEAVGHGLLLMAQALKRTPDGPDDADLRLSPPKALAEPESERTVTEVLPLRTDNRLPLPGTIAPALTDLKSKYPDRRDLVAIVTDESKRNPLTVMPPFGRNRILTEREIDAIVDFLQTL